MGQHQVGRLDVAVHDAPGMSVVESLTYVGSDFGDLTIAQESSIDQVADRVALDQLADQKRPTALGTEFMVRELEEGHDARMVQSRGSLGLAADPGTASLVGFYDLDGHVAFEAAVPGSIDRAEASTAEAVFNLEPAEYRGADHPYPGNSP